MCRHIVFFICSTDMLCSVSSGFCSYAKSQWFVFINLLTFIKIPIAAAGVSCKQVNYRRDLDKHQNPHICLCSILLLLGSLGFVSRMYL